MFKDGLRAKAWESAVRITHHLPSTRRRASVAFPPTSVGQDNDDAANPAGLATSIHSSFDDLTVLAPPCSDADRSDNEVYHNERLLPNGDFYMGQWSGNDLPHGIGKYLWTDGCMYEGEWCHGKKMGRGKFSWPCGATYEGEFKSGYMDGVGTYTGSLGVTYRGSWSMNLKQGHGIKSYSNGDCYQGEWRNGLQDGRGRYVWRNGNEYDGEWLAGVIHGQGTMVWANGNRYEGGWEDGMPKGNGTFGWGDGGLYVGHWTKEQRSGVLQQKGVYYPSATASSPTARDPDDVLSLDLQECQVCEGERISILPSQKTLNWSGMESDFMQKQAAWRSSKLLNGWSRRRTSMDIGTLMLGGTLKQPSESNSSSSGGGSTFWVGEGDMIKLDDGENDGSRVSTSVGLPAEDINELLAAASQLEEGQMRGVRKFVHPLRLPPKETKRQGETICKAHKNYELMLNLQLGIRHAVGKNAEPTTFDLKASAFDPKEKVWTRFPPEGTKQTPPHQSSEFRWKDYCPLVFRTLRKLFKVDPADYMLSICGNDALRELSSPGKSGSFFYLTNDDKYMIKTMKKSEVRVMIRMLPAYYNHVRAFENTLVTNFFGLHCVKLCTGAIQRKVRFVIIGNLFCSEYVIHRRFDLKGSSLGRFTDKPEIEIDETTTLKDLDLNFIVRLQKSWFQEFRRQVERDCEFLEQERIMDYSLLLGVHFREIPPSQDSEGDADTTSTGEATPGPSRDVDQFLCDPTRWAAIKLGINMPVKIEPIDRRNDAEALLIGEPTGELYDVVLYFGIIDILQDYDISKKLEHAYKSIQYDPTSISAVDPKQYSKRFRDFIYRVYAEDT